MKTTLIAGGMKIFITGFLYFNISDKMLYTFITSMQKLLLITLLTFLVPCVAYAQNGSLYNKVTISSPTAASLGKFVDVPVSYHTGIPSINIPIYTVKEGPLELPISISYHASGLKVLESSSWVGAGWALNAGGVVTRTVRGAPDEARTDGNGQQLHGFFSNYGYMSGMNGTESQFFYSLDFLRGYADGEPDLFTFNIGKYSGKFYFNDDRTPVLVPEQDLKVEPLYNETSGESIQGFTITDPEGVKYYFGKTGGTTGDDPVEITRSFQDNAGLSFSNVISSWYLNKIVSADNNFSIKLAYTAEKFSNYTIAMEVNFGGDAGSFKPVKNYTDGIRLNSITFSNGHVDFTPSDNYRQDLAEGRTSSQGDWIESPNQSAKALASIDIYNNVSVLKKYVFKTDYFVSNLSVPSALYRAPIVSDQKRLKLVSVQEVSGGGETMSPYSFTYYDETSVPRLLSLGMDHWGYINGATTNTTLIPTYYKINQTSRTQVSGADRDPHWPAMRAGTLSTIKYPTGGVTTLEFEPNFTVVSVNGDAVQPTLVGQKDAGWDGSSSEVRSDEVTVVTGSYKLELQNNETGGLATLKLFAKGSTSSITQLTTDPGKTNSTLISLQAGTYYFTVQKSTTTTGRGCRGYFYSMQSLSQINKMVGGLRIKNIRKYTSASATPEMTSFEYINNFNKLSNGILYSRPTYVGIVRNDINRLVGYQSGSTGSVNGCQNGDPGPYGVRISPGSLRPMETTQGYHIGYSEVRVAQVGNGYNIYRYYGTSPFGSLNDVAVREIDNSICSLSIPNFPEAPLPDDYTRGELKYEGSFKEGETQPLRETSYEVKYVENPRQTPCFIAKSVEPNPFMTLYTLKTARKTQSIVTNKEYFSDRSANTTSTTTYFESPYHHQPTRVLTINSKGEQMVSKTKYSADFAIGNFSSANCEANWMSSSQQITDQLNTILNDPNKGQTQKWNAFQKYGYDLYNTRTAYVSCSKNDRNTYISVFNSDKANADGTYKPILELQAQSRYVPIEVSNWRGGKLISAVFNKYGYVTPTSTVIELTGIQKAEFTSPQSGFSEASVVQNASINKSALYQDRVGYKYSNGNIVEQTLSGGTTTSFSWGYKNQYPIAQVQNAAASEFYYNGFEEDLSAAPGNAHTGKYFTTGSTVGWTKPNSRNYKISYWYRQLGVWKYSGEKDYTGSSSSPYNLLVAGADGYDDIKILPADAAITSYTYIPQIGISSSTDNKGKDLNYEYDSFQRLFRVRDQNANIVKQLDYKYAVQQNEPVVLPPPTTYYSAAKLGPFTKNNCGSGYTGNTVNYSVPEGKHTSTVSQAAADQLAQDEGQNYANQNGTCSIAPGSITLNTNNTGLSNTITVRLMQGSTTVKSLNFPTASNSSITDSDIPAGTYTVSVTITGSSTPRTFDLIRNNDSEMRETKSGTLVTFTNVLFNSASSARLIVY